MAAVCAHEQYAERIAANPATKDRLMAMPVEKYVAVMQNWMDQFIAGASLPVMGVREDELRSMKIPAVLMPGNDLTHSSASGRLAASLIPGCRLHELPVTDRDVQLVPYPEWAPLEPEITREFVKLMREVEARGG
jgi:hypothetical protein